MAKGKISDKYPNYVILPKESMSPTGSIYKRYDIVEQTRVLISFGRETNTIRSSAPFTVRVSVKGKIKELKSKIK